ncbi:MAG: hypothetical protein U1A77_23865 [Pirellulales bacterium]
MMRRWENSPVRCLAGTRRRWLLVAASLAWLLLVSCTTAEDASARADDSGPQKLSEQNSSGKQPKEQKKGDDQASDQKSNATKPSSSKSGSLKPSLLKSGAVKPGVAKTGISKSGISKSGDAKGRRMAANDSAPAVTPEREAAVRKFVEQHHPELVGLLESLKSKNSTEYERAVRDLFRVSERLAQSYGRDNQRYELELKLWQSQSRLDLLAARFKMSNNDELKAQIQQALDEQYSLRQAVMQLERDRVAERLKKLDEQLQTFDASREELLDRQLRLLLGKQKSATGKGS